MLWPSSNKGKNNLNWVSKHSSLPTILWCNFQYEKLMAINLILADCWSHVTKISLPSPSTHIVNTWSTILNTIEDSLFWHKTIISPPIPHPKYCHVSCSHLPRPTYIPCENYIPTHVKMKYRALYGMVANFDIIYQSQCSRFDSYACKNVFLEALFSWSLISLETC